MTRPKLVRRECGWEAPLDTNDPPREPSNAAIDHYLVFGHSIERTDLGR